MTGIGFWRASKLGLTNYLRNKWLSLAATLVVMLMLFTMSVFAVQSVVIYRTTDSLTKKIDLVVFFNESATDQQIQALRQLLANRIDVVSARYISKEDAYQIFQSRPGSDRIKTLVTPQDNPLPRSLEIHATDPSHLATISQLLTTPDYQSMILSKSDQDSAQQQLIQNLSETARVSRRNGLVLSVVFFIIAILMIFNTARIVVHAREDEIEIMRLVGSTAGFIRWPFILEGILYGIFGALMSTVLLYVFLANNLLGSTPLLSITNLLSGDMFQFFIQNLWIIILIQIGTGVLVSVGATIAAIRRQVRL